ncbi:MAG: hypothetical protein KBT11_02220 [Treponema sp.]|nr:hypothetical protein [Candidatus Treponema equifaecale]
MKKSIKVLLAMLLCTTLSFSFAGCADDDNGLSHPSAYLPEDFSSKKVAVTYVYYKNGTEKESGMSFEYSATCAYFFFMDFTWVASIAMNTSMGESLEYPIEKGTYIGDPRRDGPVDMKMTDEWDSLYEKWRTKSVSREIEIYGGKFTETDDEGETVTFTRK